MSTVIIKDLLVYVDDEQVGQFLETLEALLQQYAGDNWSYKFSVED